MNNTLMSLILACAVAATGYVIFDRYQSSRPDGISSGSALRKLLPTLDGGQAQPGSMSPKPDTAKIFKCFINGKMVYTNQQCPEGAKRREVKLRESSGFVGLPNPRPEESTEKRIGAEKEPRPPVYRSQPMKTAGDECAALKKRIEVLDGMARQPQSGQSQDWMRQERSKARARQQAIQC